MVGSQVKLPSDGATYTLYYLFPLTASRRRSALVTRGAAPPRRRCCWCWSPASPGWSPGRSSLRSGWRAGSPSGWPPGRLQERLQVPGEDDLARLATSFNQMASNLQRQIRQLEELSRVQRRFVSDVSHELRTPLTTVRMAGDVLHDARDDFDPVTARAAELLQTELDRFETLLADLLEISRFDAGAAVLEPTTSTCRRGAPGRRHRRGCWPSSGTSSSWSVAPDHPCLAEADVRRVERIVRNLVTNAIDHAETAAGGAVVVRSPATTHAAAIAVRDYGVGLAPGRRPWCSTGSGAPTRPGRGPAAAPAWASRSRWRTPTCTAAGCRPGAGPGEGAQFRLTLPRRAGGALRQSPLPLVPADAPEPVAMTRRRRGLVAVLAAGLALAALRLRADARERPGGRDALRRRTQRRAGIIIDPRPPQPGRLAAESSRASWTR